VRGSTAAATIITGGPAESAVRVEAPLAVPGDRARRPHAASA
jgi:hypothetical protein